MQRPFTNIQKNIYKQQQLIGKSPYFYIAGYVKIDNPINEDIFKEAINITVNSHELLKAEIVDNALGDVYFEIADSVEYDFPIIEVASQDAEAKCIELMHQFNSQDFSSQKLFGVQLLKAGGYNYWQFKGHHIIADSIGLRAFGLYTSIIYKALLESSITRGIKESINMQQTLGKENIYNLSPRYELDKSYWGNKLAQEKFKKLFEDQRPFRVSNSIKEIIEIKITALDPINKTLTAQSLSLYQYAVAIFIVCIQRALNKNDFLMGLDVSTRRALDNKGMFGVFYNTLPLICQISESSTWLEIITSVKKQILTDYRHKDFPGVDIFNLFKKPENGSYEAVVIYDKIDYQLNFMDKLYDMKFLDNNEILEGLSFNVKAYADSFTIHLKFNETYWNLFQTTHFREAIDYLWHNVYKELTSPVASSSFENILVPAINIPFLFNKQVLLNPEKIALIFGNKHITYHNLNSGTQIIAGYLSKLGIKAGTIVAIILDYDEQMPIVMLAILRLGAAYLPIETDTPDPRLRQIIELSKPQIILTTKKYKARLKAYSNVSYLKKIGNALDHVLEEIIITYHTPAYIVFTSGSTGEPKGVVVSHGSCCYIYQQWAQRYQLEDKPIILLQQSSYAHDVFTGNLLKTLLSGGTLVITSREERKSFSELYKILMAKKINFLDSTPSFIFYFLHYLESVQYDLAQLKTIIVGSDVCPLNEYRYFVSKYSKATRIINTYGISETTIYNSDYEVNLNNLPTSGNMPIGKPYTGINFYIFDDTMNLIEGVEREGELYISGACLALGYLNKPEFTNLKFIRNPLNQHEILYKTGDIVKRNLDEDYVFMGRADFQVKVRGFRVELGEIEQLLEEHEAITKAIVVGLKGKQEIFLAAFYESAEDINTSLLREYILRSLPEYTVPSFFIRVASYPLSNSGKIDRKQLEELYREQITGGMGSEETSNEAEQTILQIWRKIFGRNNIDKESHFLEIGGDSLLAIRIVAEMELAGFEVSMADIYYLSSIKRISESLTIIKAKETNITPLLPTIIIDTQAILESLRKQEIIFLNSRITKEFKDYQHPLYAKEFRKHYRGVYFTNKIVFKEKLNLEHLNLAVEDLLNTYAELRTVMINPHTEYIYREFSQVKGIKIPAISLNLKVQPRDKALINGVLATYLGRIDRLSGFCFRVLLISYNHSDHALFYAMDEAIHDQYGEDLLKRALKERHYAFEHNIKEHRRKNINLQEYFKLLAIGPLNTPQSSEQEILKEFKLEAFIGAYRGYNKGISSQATVSSFSLERKISFTNKKDLETKLLLGILYVCTKDYLLEPTLPVWIVHNARDSGGGQFWNTIGGFTEYVPFLMDTRRQLKELLSDYKDIMEYKAKNNIHFSYFLEKGEEKYPYIKRIIGEIWDNITASKAVVLIRNGGHLKSGMSPEVPKSSPEDWLPRWANGVSIHYYYNKNILKLNIRLPIKLKQSLIEDSFFHSLQTVVDNI